MASVWRATDAKLDRPVAIKLLYPKDERFRAAMVESFQREARIAAAIRHRNVVEILDFGTYDDDKPFMVMEVLEGETLADKICAGDVFTLDEVTSIAANSLQGLMAVHDAGIVHRDMKPENIFLIRDRDRLFPKLVDFGISKSLDTSSGRRSAITTQEGLLVGTPQYMSPEQARGLTNIDKRTDIYSVGVILYEMITGKPPYEADHVGDLMMLIMKGEAQPLFHVVPEVGRALSDVVVKAMQVDREWRFDDADEMYEALTAAVHGTPGERLGLSFPPPPMNMRPGATIAAFVAPEQLDVGKAHTLPADSEERAPGSQPGGKGKLAVSLAALGTVLAVAVGGGFFYASAAQPADQGVSRDYIVVGPKAPPPAVAEPAVVAPGADEMPTPEEAEVAAPKKPRRKVRPKAVSAAERLTQSFSRQIGKVATCFAGNKEAARDLPNVSIRFRIDKLGRVKSVRVSPKDFGSTELGTCIENKARSIKFDPQSAPIAFNIPLTARLGG